MVGASAVRGEAGLRLPPVVAHSDIVGRAACMLVFALLISAPAAQGQAIEEGGFPVKGGGVSGEPFSLSCPPRLYVEAGESVLLSCSATGVPEEGVRYGWESLSGDGLHLLSDANERSPLFTAPVSGEGAEYVYRLTAMSVGVYETATVTVIVGGVSGGSVQDRSKPPGLLEGCDSFGALEGFREGCVAGDKMPPSFEPFEGGPEDEGDSGFLFPEAPGLPDRPSGPVRSGGLGRQTPPYLECPSAVFLEELQTGTIECHASDASGEAYLDYSWEPVGGTTRDYLDNPRLIPEDASNPSVVAPEAPAYETLESFHSAETTFRYRYRLTAMSRATGLSSSSEVEVFVSSSRPSVYCPLEVVVEEGATIALDCEGVDPLSSRMDYDEEGASILWEWESLWGTSMAPLAATDLSSPLFAAPAGSSDKEYHYIVSMTSSASGTPRTARRRVTVRVVREGQAMADALALRAKGIAPSIVCEDAEIYEATEDFLLDCTAQDEPAGATYRWTGTDISHRLSGADGLTPTFSVPGDIDEPDAANKDYEYTVTMTVGGVEQASEDVTVTVKEKPNIRCARSNLGYEGGIPPGGSHRFDPCPGGFRGAPAGSDYELTWIPIRTFYVPESAALAALDRTDRATAVFTAPLVSPHPDRRMFYTYRLRASAENADPVTLFRIGVSVIVRDMPELSVTCSNSFYEVDEGDPDFDLDCEASGAWFERTYTWQWSPTANLTGHDTGTPTFNVPGDVDRDTTYAYTVRVTSGGHHPDETTIEVTVRASPPVVACEALDPVYEGSADITLDCSVQDEPDGATYSWTGTDVSNRLTGTDGLTPTFAVPDNVNENTDYDYTVTLSVNGAEQASADISVTVLNKGALAVVCTDTSPAVYEGSDDFALECEASGAPGDDPQYTYAWTARGIISDTDLLSNVDIASPVFFVPDEVTEDETYEYLLTVSAENAESATAEVTVTVLDRVQTPSSEPVSPPVDSPPPLASSSAREPFDPSALGVTISVSSLRFGVQASQTEVSLDPLTDQISTRVSGPYHAGRMTLSPGGAAFEENGEMALSINLVSPVLLKREEGAGTSSIVLVPVWSFAQSCEQLSSQTAESLYTEITLTEGACRLLRFGGKLNLVDVPSGRYTGSLDIVLRSGEGEETHSVEVEVTVVSAQRVITIGPGGVRFSTSRELPAGLTEEQNLSIYPDVAFLTEEKPHGVFELSNPSLVPLEVSVSARFGYTEATANGREVVVRDTSLSRLGDLSRVVDIHPGVLVLQPGEKGYVRYGVKAGALASMGEKGYAAFFDVVSEPRQYVRSDRMPEEVVGERTARVTMRVPGVYVPGEGASELRAELLSVSYGVSMSATFLVETPDRPFAGEVVAYDGEGVELGRRKTLVYTRSRVRIPLDRMPEEETVFLRFVSRESGRVSEPVSVEWNVPERDIGVVESKEKTPTSQTLANRP